MPSPETYIRLPNPKLLPVAIGIFVLVILALTSFHVIPPGNRGISITLGKVNSEVRAEGITFKKPFIESIVDVSVRQRTTEGAASAFSSDLQTVEVAFKTLYRLPENRVVRLFQQYQGDPYQSLVEPRIQEELKQTTALYRAEELVKNREKIKLEVLSKVQNAVGDLVLINDFAITDFSFTDELEKAIEQKTIREQEAFAKSFELDKARKDAEITIVNAEAEARSVKIKGEAIRLAPDVISLEIVKKWNGVAPQSVVTGHGGASILLPLK